eukprot:CAMPEP_0197590114 /NCGR_PEP_ID=MMETSP1326-20131121/10810_1 /TAXON_ID=1155430 /ORGANISM="Genus nov. species nov., Strain RCC2288" /LENGTH=348 /DNA_ID=CAMNT_0043155115 /DNA_START=15 /DNA_END=1061 /DNA_ORIENTATION=-
MAFAAAAPSSILRVTSSCSPIGAAQCRQQPRAVVVKVRASAVVSVTRLSFSSEPTKTIPLRRSRGGAAGAAQRLQRLQRQRHVAAAGESSAAGGAAAAGAGAGESQGDSVANAEGASSSTTTSTTVGTGAVDFKAIGTYFGATVVQALLMIYITQKLDFALLGVSNPLAKNGLIAVWFLFNALRSRTFSPLNAARPKVAGEKAAIAERKRPGWMPPPLAFPVIWSTIALLRAGASVAVFGATGTLNHPAIHAMIVHLAVGDTWNSINNVEKRLGTAVLGVGCVLLSVYNVVWQYYGASATAGYIIAPSALWISVAAFLVYTIWKINPGPDGVCEPLLPRKQVLQVAAA